ncbi:unnamed protein product [Acanthoscelides obtectus]|uniref:Dynein axonemal assembly factor 11-like CS domain-containing protein n=1 Tax=Acanthoscelides obtectus TaxID=200917 RepID=A0A9P0PLU2_ACAOB|nr:unnamed protein product [Acanthoscelides obtectus]CAK1664585.1 Protein tilB [Acanthoscelides obtectus]
MVRITEDLVRKKAEHNESIIGTLEELSLHQEDVEKIEHLNNWCRGLQILYLQANLISKIENLNKLKKLQYLNLAINNIEVIENLKGCESLEKLDLTLNFVGNLESVCSLKDNINLRELILTGNPCCEYKGYRDYVIAKLPQLVSLDVKEITKSERIKAFQNLPTIEPSIRAEQEAYRARRDEQCVRVSCRDTSHLTDEEFWQTTSEHCPESRIDIAARHRRAREENNKEDAEVTSIQRSVRLFTKGGRPLNVNQAKLNFKFKDDDPAQYVLDVAVYKFLDGNLIDVDLQPIYVKITIKGKVFQMVFPEEVYIEKSICQRSQSSGHLILKMPKVNYKPRLDSVMIKEESENTEKAQKKKNEYLEVQEKKDDMDFSKIVERNDKIRDLYDNPEIPPLEYF